MNNFFLDLTGLLCPLPVIKVQNQIQQMQTGDKLMILCTDPGTKHDIPCWCRMHKHGIELMEKDNQFQFEITVGADDE